MRMGLGAGAIPGSLLSLAVSALQTHAWCMRPLNRHLVQAMRVVAEKQVESSHKQMQHLTSELVDAQVWR